MLRRKSEAERKFQFIIVGDASHVVVTIPRYYALRSTRNHTSSRVAGNDTLGMVFLIQTSSRNLIIERKNQAAMEVRDG